ncbi:MAG TPA: hypothetical protein VEQ63_05860, partial [Bryobacteraceae bacterium]|nr:hypothetical protein [Bryobacteraceae bacterium]
MKRPVRVLLRLLGIGAAVAVLFGLAAVIVLPSQWFREKVRLRIVEETERATGGKVEIGSFQFDWRSLRAEVSPFVLRGTEPPAERPLFRAEALAVDLKIVSMLKRDIDVQSVLLDRPQLNLLVGETGITNLPRPQRPKRASDSALAPLMKLAIQKIRLRDGELRYGDQRVKLQLYGERLNAQLAYNFAGPSYKGEVSLERLDVNAPPVLPMSAAFQSNVELFEHRLKIHVARAQTRTAQMEASGGVENFANPQVSLSLNTYGSLAELGKPLRLPIEHTGNVQFRGVMLYNSAEKLRVQGRLTGQGLAVRQAGIFVRNIAVASDVKYGPGLVAMTGVRVDALDGRFDGSAELRDLNQYRVNGKVT